MTVPFAVFPAKGWIAGRRVLMLAPPASRTGAPLGEIFISRVTDRLVGLGADVEVIRFRPTMTRTSTLDRRRSTSSRYLRPSALSQFLWVMALVRARLHGRTDLVIDCCSNNVALASLIFYRCATVLLLIPSVPTETDPPNYFRRWTRITTASFAGVAHGNRPVLVVSPADRRAVRKQLHLRGPMHVIPFGVDRADSAKAHPSAWQRRGSPSIVWVCDEPTWLANFLRLGPDLFNAFPGLRVDFLMERPPRLTERAALSLLPDARVWVHTGRGAQAVDVLLVQAWIIVQLSETRAWPRLVLQAAEHGVPAALAESPTSRQAVIPGRTGWLIGHGEDAMQVVDHALTGLRDPVVAAEYARQCRSWASTFDWDATARRLLSVWAAEAARMRNRPGSTRRRRSDLVTLAQFTVADPAAFVRFTETELRLDDVWELRGQRVWLLCSSCDESDLATIVDRAKGFDATFSVAETGQLYGPPRRPMEDVAR